MTQIWSGYTEYFDEIIDTFLSAGIKTEYDTKKWTIYVGDDDYINAYGMLTELNQLLGAGW